MSAVEFAFRLLFSHEGLTRYRPLLLLIEFSLFVIGALFWIDANMGGTGFTPDVWGTIAYAIPVKVWAMANMGAAAITFIGLADPPRWWMVFAGALLHGVQSAILCVSVTLSGGELVVGMYSLIFFLPLHFWIGMEALRHGYANK